MCAVALEVTSKKIVFECMQSVFQSDAEFKSLRTRIHGAKWANRAIHLLSRTEWGSRSWDLIYAANNQVNFYRQFNDYSITPDDLIGRLKMEFNPEDTQTISVPLAIPSIIQTIFRDLVPLEKICECLGYELCDYNKLDLSGLEKLLAVSANADLNDTEPIDTEPTNTVPNDAEPNDVGPNDAETNDAGPNKKRKSGPLKTSSKRRCRNVSSGSPEGHYFGISNGSHWSNHATPAPSEPGSDSVMGGLFEEFPTSTSSPAEVSLDIDASEEMVGSRVGDANCSNHSAQQSIIPQSHVDLLFHRGDNIPGIALPRDAGSRTSSAVIISDFESESRADQLSTADLGLRMNGTLDLESNSSSNMATLSASTTPSQTFSPNNITQQQGSKFGLCNLQVETHTDSEEIHSQRGQTYSKNVSCNSGCEPLECRNEHVSHIRPSGLPVGWLQQYRWEIDDILQQGLAANNPQPPTSTDWSQQYRWEIDDILQQGLPANNPQPPTSTDWSQQYRWEIDDILQQGLAANNPQPPTSTDWSQQYRWEIDDILQQGLPANNPQPPPSTEWWQQYSSNLLQQDLSLSNHSPLPSLGSGQEAGTAIPGYFPETRYHLLFRSSLVSREGSSSWDSENSRHALGFSEAIHQNASDSPNRRLSVM
ncbi:hypothetical protein N7485_012002 [Penicillium canescens]|nr:hypothetical protein N7485_012002 [Penicillium canescens]